MMDFVWENAGLVAIAVSISVVLAVLGGLATEVGPWYENLRFPSWRPPNWLFGPVWTTIYVLVVSAAVIAYKHAPDESARAWLIGLFALNGVLNVLWSPLFFKLRRPDWALVEIVPYWLSIAALLHHIAGISTLAGELFSPYLLWVTFAGYLNWRMVELNKPFETHWPLGRS